MRRLCAGILALALVLTIVAPAAAMAEAPLAVKMAMLREQVASQTNIVCLLGASRSYGTWVTYINFGTRVKTGAKIVVPVRVYFRNGTSLRGTLVARRYGTGSGTKWFFYSITRGTSEGGISNVPIPAGITSSAVSTSIAQQSLHQYLLRGILSGGYKRMTVLSRSYNWNTRQVNVRLSGGTRPSTLSRVVAYRKTATNGKTLWFISAIK